MAGFLDRYAETKGGIRRFGVANRALARAQGAGFIPKQIATAITKGYGSGLRIGDALRPGAALHTQMAGSTRGNPGNWIFHHMGPSGHVGYGGLQEALAQGRTPDELRAAGHLLAGGNPNYGVTGFGLRASQHLQDLKKDALHQSQLKQLQDNSDKLLEKAIETFQPAEPPKPTLGTTPVGQFVSGTSRLSHSSQGATRGRGSRTLRGRFGRDFRSPLSIAAGRGSGSSSSSVLNTAA